MKATDLYYLSVTKIPSQLNDGEEGQALYDIRERYFSDEKRQAELFDLLTQTPQKTAHILERQSAVKDVLHNGADGIFGVVPRLSSLNDRIGSDEMVKVWKKERTYGGYREEPLIYDHRRLEECVKHFQSLCRDILESLGHVTSGPFKQVKDFFSQFVDHSQVTQGWSRDSEILKEAEMPFLSFARQNPWSHQLESLMPIGSIDPEEKERMMMVFRKALKDGFREATITLGGESFTMNFVVLNCPDVTPKYRNEPKTGRFLDFDLFSNIRQYVYQAKEILESLSFYRAAAKMHQDIVKRRLPVCFPTLSETNVLDLQDFYPLHLGKRKREYTFNSIHLSPDNPFALITGKNNGGKSTLLEVLNALAAMTKAGLPLPATSATVGNFETIVHRRTVSEDRRHGRGALLNQACTAEGDLGTLHQSQSGIGFFDEPVAGTDAATNEIGMREILQILMYEVKKPTVIVTHCTPVAKKVLASPDEFPGVQLFHFRKGENGKPDRKMYSGVGESDGADILKKAGLSLKAFREKRRKK